jgi:hypothetical protein
MINLRSKLHLARQGRKSSLSNPPCLGTQCDAAIPTQPAGTSPGPEPAADIPTLSSTTPRPSLETLPEEPLRRVALFCDFDDLLSLRRTCRALRQTFDTLSLFDVSCPSFLFLPFISPPVGSRGESGVSGGGPHTRTRTRTHTHIYTTTITTTTTPGLHDPCPLFPPQQSYHLSRFPGLTSQRWTLPPMAPPVGTP